MADTKTEMTTKSGKCTITLSPEEIRIDLTEAKKKELEKKSELARKITYSIFPILLTTKKLKPATRDGDTITLTQRGLLRARITITLKNNAEAKRFQDALDAILKNHETGMWPAGMNTMLVFEGTVSEAGKSATRMDAMMRVK